MVFNPRRNDVPDGSITAPKLASAAVTSTALATGAVTTSALADNAVDSNKLADNAVITAKINDNAVATAKLAAQAVTLAKSVDALRRKTLFGSETDLSVTGTSRKRVERFQNAKDSSQFNGQALEFLAQMKISATGTATLEVWVDNDSDWNGSDAYIGSGSPDLTITSTSTVGEIKAGILDISALSNGNHVFNVSLKASGAGLTATSDYRQYFVKE